MSTEHPSRGQWQRLSGRIIWVDLAQIIVTQLPLLLVIWVMNVALEAGTLWPLIGLAAVGLIGAIADAVRWLVTFYRITPSYVELKTGVLFRRHRSIQRDRIRSIDTEAKLRHRVAGLRVVTIGAGQQATEDEAALELDALIAVDAQALRQRLLTTEVRQTPGQADETPSEETEEQLEGADRDTPLQVFARFRPGWMVYNIFNIWAFVMAFGLVAGTWFLLGAFNIYPAEWIIGLADWGTIGWIGTTVLALIAVSLLRVLGLAVNYFTEYWKFELSRVRGPESTELRTRQGLFTTREVNRDESRIRGFSISQPLFWRWMGVTDTEVVTTGLSLWSMSQPAAILPRTPLKVAHRVVADIIGPEPNPFDAPLIKHPRAALRRRLWWATGLTLMPGAILGVLVFENVIPIELLLAVAAFWLLALTAAVIAYRALGHAITGGYLVVRSGLLNRATVALQREATSTVVIRESLFQRRLGLQTVSAMTAAGYGGYDAPDLHRDESLQFAIDAAPGILDDFLEDAGRQH